MTKKLWIFMALISLSWQALAYQRIVSINLCTDTLLHLLEDQQHIASFSYLAGDATYSPFAGEIRDIPLNHALVEEILPLKPDLILAGSYSSLNAVFFLKHLGFNVKQMDVPFNLQGIRQAIMEMGDILGKSDKARAIIADMDKREAQIAAKVAQIKQRPSIVSFGPSGFTFGAHSMQSDLLEMAGFDNIAIKAGIQGLGNLNIEQLIYFQPDFLIVNNVDPHQNSMAQRLLLHPVLKDGLPNTRRLVVPYNLWACASPYMTDALELLIKANPEVH